jgi:hypothetical protein
MLAIRLNGRRSWLQDNCNRTDILVIENNYASYATYTDYLEVSAAHATKAELAGIFSLLASRLMPRHLFTAPERVDSPVDGVIEVWKRPEVYLISLQPGLFLKR